MIGPALPPNSNNNNNIPNNNNNNVNNNNNNITQQQQQPTSSTTTTQWQKNHKKKQSAKKVWYEKINYQIGMKNAMYGSIVGSVMGSFFGLQMGLNIVNVKRFGDVFGLLGKSSTKRTIVLKSIAGTTLTFGAFFATYQFINHSISCIRDDDTDMYQFPLAGILAGLPFIKVKYMNKNLPYAGAFIALDCYSWYSTQEENSIF